jgi:hypothetical protein
VKVIVAVWVGIADAVLVEVGIGVIESTGFGEIIRVGSFMLVFVVSGSFIDCVAETEQEAMRKLRIITTRRFLMDTIDSKFDDDLGLDSLATIHGGQKNLISVEKNSNGRHRTADVSF